MNRLVLFVLLCLAAGLAHADCDGPISPLSTKEKAYYSANFPVLRAAIPKPPAGWQYNNRSQEELAPDYTEYMPANNCGPSIYYMGLAIGYERPMGQEDMDKMTQAMQAAPDPEKQKKLDALQAQQQALIQKMGDAAQKQDTRAMTDIGKQSDALSKQMQALQQDMNSGRQATLDAIQRDRNAEVHVSINANAGSATCYGSPKPLSVPGATAYQCGAPADYRSPGDVLDPAKGEIIVVFGQATVKQYDYSRRDNQGKQVKDSYVKIEYPTNSDNSLAVHNVMVEVSGDDLARAQSLYSQMDLKPLAALLKK